MTGRGWLRERLATPAREVSLRELVGGFFHAIVRVEVAVKGAPTLDPALPGRIRGALGDVLLRSASPEARAELPCPWHPPCALDVLMGRYGNAAPGLAIPAPWVLRVAPEQPGLVIHLTVIGFATDWVEAVAEALVTAIREGDLLGTARTLEPVRRVTEAVEGLAVPKGMVDAVGLVFQTPLSLRSGSAGAAAPTAFPGALLRRIVGLARWQDAELAPAELEALTMAAGMLSVTWVDDAPPPSWFRRSTRQRRTIPVEPLGRPVLLLRGEPVADLLPALALGELCHGGGRTSLGLGRYELRSLPGTAEPCPRE